MVNTTGLLALPSRAERATIGNLPRYVRLLATYEQEEVVVMARRIGALLAALTVGAGWGAIAGAAPAAAGNWAVTVIDPRPSGLTAGQAHEVSFWVLQHGTHPFDWGTQDELGEVGLTFTDAHGKGVHFAGRALAEPAHYVATVTLPRDGTWQVVGVQGTFMDFHVGSWTVPGSLTALGVPAAPSAEDLSKYWPGEVRPPVMPVNTNRDPFGQAPEVVIEEPATAPSAQVLPAADAERAGAQVQPAVRMPVLLAVAVAGVMLALGLGLGGRSWWLRRRRAATAAAAPASPASPVGDPG
jgi:hypothetical protein